MSFGIGQEKTCCADFSIEFANYKCLEFYDSRRESDHGKLVSQKPGNKCVVIKV